MKLEITKNKILAMAKKCPEAKEVLEEGFPEAFEGEEKDITKELRVELDSNFDGNAFVRLYYGDTVIAYTGSNAMGTTELKLGANPGIKESYELVVNDSGDFRIFKKN